MDFFSQKMKRKTKASPAQLENRKSLSRCDGSDGQSEVFSNSQKCLECTEHWFIEARHQADVWIECFHAVLHLGYWKCGPRSRIRTAIGFPVDRRGPPDSANEAELLFRSVDLGSLDFL